MSPKIKNAKVYLHYTGFLLAFGGILFVIIKLHDYWQQIQLSSIRTTEWIMFSLLTLLYAAINILLALAWKYILKHYQVKVDSGWAICAYGISQLAKYVPGNIFHIAGRQALAMSAGMPGKSVLKANVVELAMISGLGALSLWIIASLVFPAFSLSASFSCLLVSTAGIIYLAKRLFSENIAKAILCQLLFLISSATIFVTILTVLTPEKPFGLPLIVSAGGVYTIAWLAGLIMPGAPAGIGIRELVVVWYLSEAVPDAELLLAVLMGRIITVTGDVIFFIISGVTKKFSKSV